MVQGDSTLPHLFLQVVGSGENGKKTWPESIIGPEPQSLARHVAAQNKGYISHLPWSSVANGKWVKDIWATSRSTLWICFEYQYVFVYWVRECSVVKAKLRSVLWRGSFIMLLTGHRGWELKTLGQWPSTRIILLPRGHLAGWFYSPEDIWQFLETFLTFLTTEGKGCYWHLLGRSQNAANDPTVYIKPPNNKEWFHSKMSIYWSWEILY